MFAYFIYIIAGMGAGIGTGLAGLSAAAVISPMLITFLGFDPYEAVGISLASDVLASAIWLWVLHFLQMFLPAPFPLIHMEKIKT